MNEEILHLKGADAAKMEQQQKQIYKLTKISQIFKNSELSAQHAFLKRVFKHGLTFREGAFRTIFMHPLFEHNLLILNEKRLLFLEQPGQNFGGVPLGGAGGSVYLIKNHHFRYENKQYTLIGTLKSTLFKWYCLSSFNQRTIY